MYARVSTIKVAPDQTEASIRYFEDAVVPTTRGLPGFERATLLVNRDKGMTKSLTYWSSRADLDASAEAATRLRTTLKDTADSAELVSVEIFEVAVDVTGGKD